MSGMQTLTVDWKALELLALMFGAVPAFCGFLTLLLRHDAARDFPSAREIRWTGRFRCEHWPACRLGSPHDHFPG